MVDGWYRTREPAGTPKGGQFATKPGMDDDMDLACPPVPYENGELLLSDRWRPVVTNTLIPDDTTHTYVNHGKIIEFSHRIFENDDVSEEIYEIGYTDGTDSIAMRDWRGVGRDARPVASISPIRTFARLSDGHARQPNGTRPNIMDGRCRWIMSNSDPTARMIRTSSPTTGP